MPIVVEALDHVYRSEEAALEEHNWRNKTRDEQHFYRTNNACCALQVDA